MASNKKKLIKEKALHDEGTQKDRFLTFTVGNKDYGQEIYHVTGILGTHKITRVPDMPDYVKGVIKLRGKVIPVMDVRKRLKFDKQAYNYRTCIAVMNINDTPLGMLVDTVNEISDTPQAQLQLHPNPEKSNRQLYNRRPEMSTIRSRAC